jgi:hypothetical protein
MGASYSEDGEGELALQEDGSFSGGISTTYSWTPANGGLVTCTITPDSGPNTFDVAGTFDSGDGTLDFTRLKPESTTLNGATCKTPNGTVSASLPADVSGAGSVALAGGADVQVPYHDGGEVVVPVDGEMATGDVTLDLAFEVGGTPVATQELAN